MTKLTEMKEITKRIARGDLLVFGYVHGGYDPLFKALGETQWDKKLDVFIPCVFRYRNEDRFHLDEACRHFDGRFLITQIAPEFSGLLKSGTIDLLPLPLSQVPAYLKGEALRRKVWVFCEIGEPDEKGFCNTGYSAPFPLALFENCETVGLINKKVPPTYGDTAIPARSFKYFVQISDRLPLFPEPDISEVTRTIGSHTAELVEDGSLIEAGIGEIIASVLTSLTGKKNLTYESGCFSEDVRPLIEQGVITGRSAGNVTGARSEGFYEWLRMNPAVEIRTMEFTHNIQRLAAQPRFVALGSALAVDLLGQVASETIGPSQLTGIGGALDFAKASGIGGGKSIIAMASTYGKNVSKIVPFFEKGDVVSLTRYDVDYIVTEYGIAELRHQSRRQRALNLIRIAHPENRELLESRAKQASLI